MGAALVTDDWIRSSVRALRQRAEQQHAADSSGLRLTFVDPGGLRERMSIENSQILFGRRGTGKTHLLSVLAPAEDEISVYVDLRRLMTTTREPEREPSVEVEAAALYQQILGEVRRSIDHYARRGPTLDPKHSTAHALQEFERVTTAALKLNATVTDEESATTTADGGASVHVEIGSNPKLGGSVSASDGRSFTRNRRLEDVREIPFVSMRDVHAALSEVLRALRVSKLLLLLDEWSEMPPKQQPYIADHVRRTFIGHAAVSVKVAAIAHRAVFAIEREGRRIGFELNSDFATGANLDQAFMHRRDPERARRTFAELLYAHVAFGAAVAAEQEKRRSLFSSWRSRGDSADDRVARAIRRVAEHAEELPGFGESFADGFMRETYGIEGPADLVARLFERDRKGDAFQELVEASEGVVRTFIDIFTTVFLATAGERIRRRDVRAAARTRSEEKRVNVSRRLRNALDAVADYVGEHGGADTVLVGEDAEEALDAMRALHDALLVHQLAVGVKAPSGVAPGSYFVRFALDYGSYGRFQGRRQKKRRPELVLPPRLILDALDDEPEPSPVGV